MCLFFSFKYRCLGAIKKLMRKTLAAVSTILEPAAIIKLASIKSPKTEAVAPKVEERKIMLFRLLAQISSCSWGNQHGYNQDSSDTLHGCHRHESQEYHEKVVIEIDRHSHGFSQVSS